MNNQPLDQMKVKLLHSLIDHAVRQVLEKEGMTLRPTKVVYDSNSMKYTAFMAISGQPTFKEARAVDFGDKILKYGDRVTLSDRACDGLSLEAGMKGTVEKVKRVWVAVKLDDGSRFNIKPVDLTPLP